MNDYMEIADPPAPDEGLQREKALRNLVWEKILRQSRREHPGQIRRLLELADIKLCGSRFAVMVARIIWLDLDSDYETTGPQDPRLDDFDRVGFALETLVCEEFGDLGAVYSINIGDGTPLILNLSDEVPADGEGFWEDFIRRADTVARRIEEEHGIVLNIAVHQSLTGIEDMSDAYESAYRLSLRYMSIDENGSRVFSSNGLQSREYHYAVESTKKEHQFFETITAGDYDAAAEYLGELSASILMNKNGAQRLPVLLSHYMWRALELYMPPLSLAEKSEAVQKTDQEIETFRQGRKDGFGTVSEVKELAVVLVESFRQSVCSDRTVVSSPLFQAAVYIQENCRDQQLNVDAVSEKFGYQRAHFTRAFKRAVGMNPLDYLHTCRISEAKRLLRETEFTVSEIAVRTGYLNSRALNYSFKRYEGITPGRFREMQRTAEK